MGRRKVLKSQKPNKRAIVRKNRLKKLICRVSGFNHLKKKIENRKNQTNAPLCAKIDEKCEMLKKKSKIAKTEQMRHCGEKQLKND